MTATPVTGTILVESVVTHGDLTILYVRIAGTWESFRDLPNVVSFEGRSFGKSAWNSDTGYAYYRSDRLVAHS